MRPRAGLAAVAAWCAIAPCTGCTTLTLWSADGFWPPATNRVEAIAAASLSPDTELHLHLAHRSPWWRSYRVPCTPSGEWLRVVPTDEAPPPTARPVPIVTADELASIVAAHADGTQDALARGVWIAVTPYGDGDALLILDARDTPRLQRVELPSCGLAWTSPNLAGHVVATPVAVAVDAVTTLPLFVVVGVLMACGVRIGH